MPTTVAIPVMRRFKHPQLEKVKIKDGDLTDRDLRELVSNTNFLIKEGKHVPGYRLTHSGDDDKFKDDKGKAIGWVSSSGLKMSGFVAVADSEFTPRGRALVKNRDIRWVSPGIKRDFKLTGEPDGPILPGLYLDHIAVLGDENPAIKGLVDLSQVQLPDGDSVRPGTAGFSVSEEEGEVCYFSEIESHRKEIADMATEDKDTISKAEFSELKDSVANLAKIVTKAVSSRDDENDAVAEFNEQVDDDIAASQEELKYGAEFSEALKSVGRAQFGNKRGQRAFAGLLKSLPKFKTAPTKRLAVAVDDDDEAAELSEQDFIDAAGGAKAGMSSEAQDKITRVLDLKRKQLKKPDMTIADLRKSVAGR